MKEKKPPGKLFCADYKCSIYIGTDNIIRVGAPTTYYKNEGDLKELFLKFSGMMLGIIDIDVFEAGFVVWFGVPTSKSFKEQSAFVRTNQKDILDYIQEEIQILPPWKRAAALLPFCRPTEITVTRTNSVAVSYDIKEGIQRVLESEENHE